MTMQKSRRRNRSNKWLRNMEFWPWHWIKHMSGMSYILFLGKSLLHYFSQAFWCSMIDSKYISIAWSVTGQCWCCFIIYYLAWSQKRRVRVYGLCEDPDFNDPYMICQVLYIWWLARKELNIFKKFSVSFPTSYFDIFCKKNVMLMTWRVNLVRTEYWLSVEWILGTNFCCKNTKSIRPTEEKGRIALHCRRHPSGGCHSPRHSPIIESRGGP
jgi:hypothetical protein